MRAPEIQRVASESRGRVIVDANRTGDSTRPVSLGGLANKLSVTVWRPA